MIGEGHANAFPALSFFGLRVRPLGDRYRRLREQFETHVLRAITDKRPVNLAHHRRERDRRRGVRGEGLRDQL
jgi:hypothetical protein